MADPTSPKPRRRSVPRGKEEVTAAILDAATQLIARRGPAAVSIREVAALAGVNHGLVHRHFGSKAKLVLAVHNRLAEQLAPEQGPIKADRDTALNLYRAVADNPDYWRVLARSALDGELSEVVASRLPVTRELAAQLERALPADSGVTGAELVAMNLAFSLGWLVFEDFVRAASGADGDVVSRWFELQRDVVTNRRRRTARPAARAERRR